MIPKRDNCREIDELIHLSVDGRLDEIGKGRLEKHLAACRGCAEKLERLRATEAGARSIGLDEPPQEYWSTFSGRVIEKIEAGAGRKPAWNRTSAFAGLFGLPRQRLRLAAGVASLAIVIVAGALYLHDRGRITPFAPIRQEAETAREAENKYEPMTEPDIEPKADLKVEQAILAKTRKQIDAQHEEKRGAPAAEGKSPEMAPAEKEQAPAAIEPSRAVAVESAAAPPVEPSAAPAGEPARVEALESAKSLVVAGKSRDRAALVDTAARVADIEPLKRAVSSLAESKGERSVEALRTKSGAPTAAMNESFVLDGTIVRRVSTADTSMSEVALRSVIHQWRSHIERNPLDPKNSQGYVQVATGYYLLARLTRNELVISEGARLVQEYADRVDDPGLKGLLLDSKERIESFRGK